MPQHARHREPRIASWAGRIFLLAGRALYVGRGADTERHSHHAIQLTLALEGTIRLQVGDGSAHEYEVVLNDADVAHRMTAPSPLALLFIAPESPAGRRCRELLAGRPACRLDRRSAALLVTRLARVAEHGGTVAEGGALCDALIDLYAPAATPRSQLDPRVERAVAILEQAGGDLGARDVALQVGLSVSRIRHLFTEQVGLPIRTYLLWVRLLRAVEAMAAGANITDSAHAAGFADSAHLWRTFRKTFGMSPSSFVPGSQFVRPPDGTRH